MICALVLAAGRSRRMGTQKLVLSLGDKPVIAHVVDQLLQTPVHEIVVVVGADAEQIKLALQGRPLRFVSNPAAEGDMLSSIRCGLRALPGACNAFLVALGDLPGVTAALVTELIRAFQAHGPGIVLPTHHGRRGHPILFAARFRDEVLDRFDGVGLRGLLHCHPESVFEFEVASDAVLHDIDSPADFERVKGRFTS